MKLFRSRPLLLLLLLNVLICLLFFYPILGHLNTILLSAGGDGIKNYFTYLYYIHFDQGAWFTGMNYPFGEHVVFTDNMPLLSWSISWLKQWFPGIAGYSLGIMHSSFIVAYFLASWFIYRILSLYGVKGWWAVVSAVFITYFSPQFLRLSGHFGLSYTCFLPMLIYWIMRYEQERKVRFLVWIYLATIIFTFCHVYYLAFSLILMAAYCFAYLVATKRPWGKKLLYCLPPALTVAAALLTFNLYFRVTDPVTDRPIYPIGYLGARVAGEDILTSDFNFIGANIFRPLFGRASSGSEGYTYVGIISILVCLFLVYRFIGSLSVRVAQRKRIPSHPVRRHRVWLITALVVLLFSMGVPFVWGMEFLVDYVSTFRQFRSIGRFAWIFYYLTMIYSAVWLYRYAQAARYRDKRLRLVTVAAVLITGVYFIELNGYAQQLHRTGGEASGNYSQFFTPENESWKTWLAQQGCRPEQFQASVGLPYFHIGSEKLGLQNNDYPTTMYFGSQLAMQTGLGMMDVMMSRTSWSQSFASVRFFDGPFTEKKIAGKLNHKPLLLFVNTNNPLTSGESYMLRYAIPVGSRWGIDFYSLDIGKMLAGDRKVTDSCRQLALADSRTEGLLGDTVRFSYSQHFDQYPTANTLAGKGALLADTVRNRLFLTIPVSHPTEDTAFVFTTWLHCYPDRPEMPHIYYEQLDNNGKVIFASDYLANHSTYITEGSWYKAERIVTIRKEASSIRMYVRFGIKEFIALDEVLIQPVNSIYFYKADDTHLLLNNRPVPLKKGL